MRKNEIVFLVITLIIVCIVNLINVTSPFLYHNESPGTQYGITGRSLVNYDILKLKFAPLFMSGPITYYDDYRKYYRSDHPFIPSLLTYISFKLFGVHEWSIRIVFILFALCGVALFYILIRKLIGITNAMFGTAIFAFNPMYVYHSSVTVHQITPLVFILLAFYFYFLWRESKRVKYYIGILISIFLACNMDWPGYYIAMVLFVYHFFVEKRNKIWAIFFIVANIIIFGIYLLHLYILDPSGLNPIKNLLSVGKSRSFLSHHFSFTDYILREFKEFAIYFTVPVIILSVIWLIKIILSKRSKLDYFILATSLLGLDEIFFLDLCYEHDYCSYQLVVFFTLAAVAGLIFLKEQLFRWKKAMGIAVIVIFASGFIVQSAVILHNRFTKIGAWEFYYKMAQAISEKTDYKDKIIMACHNVPWYTPFYADRYFNAYNPVEETLLETSISKPITGIDINKFKDFISKNEKGFKWVITTSNDLVLETVPFFQKIKQDSKSEEDFNSILRKFYVETKGSESELYKFLDANYTKEIYKGFIFFKLK